MKHFFQSSFCLINSFLALIAIYDDLSFHPLSLPTSQLLEGTVCVFTVVFLAPNTMPGLQVYSVNVYSISKLTDLFFLIIYLSTKHLQH